AAGPVGAVGGETGDERDRRRWDLARLLLSARDQGAQRDAAGAGTGSGQRRESGRDGTAPADQASGGQAREGGVAAATLRANALRPAQADKLWAGEDAPRPPTDDDNALDAGWAQKLALLDDAEKDDVNDALDQAAGFEPYDPDAGWRDRGPERWERKLAGAVA